jgi:acyl-coenzyme A synthetase/AMP-(fatty) acid ligase/thioesterase domain-containing protein
MATGIVEWATRAPERAAVVDVHRTLTLGELDAAAAALAARLLDNAVPPEAGEPSWLPIVVDRSVASAVAIHGALRAGCAFARIESTMPRELVAELFTRLGDPHRAIVADPRYPELLPDGVEVVRPFGHEGVGAAAPQPVDHEAPASVQFTSGSSGRPKGVVSPWSSLDARVQSAMGVGPSSGVDQWTEGFVQQFGAGSAVRALALPCVGRTVCMADPTTMSIDDLLDWFDANQVDSVAFTPMLLHAIVRVGDGRPRLPSVSLFRLISEAAHWSLVAPLRRLVGPHLTIRAGYAASEVGPIAHFDIGPDDPIGEGRIPVGHMEPGVEVRLEPLADDPSTTQLVVARPHTLGYLADPELTAYRYVTDEDGTRWWRSADIMRVDNVGTYHHLGRADEMAKVKGAFVAPSRVEEALQSIDGIGAAATTLHRAANDSVRVVARVQVVDDTLTPERVDAQLRERLPPELVPAILVRHEELPRTQRMKLDRRALENEPLVRWRSSPARKFTSEFEWWCLAEVRRIIGLDDVGPDDDLFKAGLDSIGALELGAAVADAGFGEFDPPRLLEARTVAGIDRMLGETRDPNRSTVVMLNEGGCQPTLFALPGGGGNALEYRFLADALGRDQPIAVIEPRGMHCPGPPDRTLDGLATHVFEEIEARLGPDDPCLILAFSGGGPAAYEAAQRMHAKGRHVHLVLLDSAPSTKGRQRARGPGAAEELDPGTQPTIRTASVKELPAAVLRSVRHRRRVRQFGRLVGNPGPPSFEHERYRAFKHILGTASREYDPEPAAFPATLVQVDGSDALRRCGQLIPDLAVRDVGGEHVTMLAPPHVEGLAVIVAAAAQDCFESKPQHRSV